VAPKLVDKEKRKRELALIALDVFAQKGFDAASVSDVASAAGISKGSVYTYFESKEDLIATAITAWAELMVSETAESIARYDDPGDRLRETVRAVMRAFISDDRIIRLSAGMFQLFLNNQDFYSRYDLSREALQGMRRIVIDCLLDGVSRGAFRSEIARDAERLAINLVAYLDGIALHYYMGREYFDLMGQVDFHLDGFLGGLRVNDRIPGQESR
jgi:AcrR family transcriptional regulator